MNRRTLHFGCYRTFLSAIAVACLLCGFGAGQISRAADGAPTFQVDASWPQPLPNKWALGQVAGIAMGPQDHVWILHRPSTLGKDEIFAAENPPSAECCIPAPPVIEFDAAGKVVRAWGGPGQGYDWPLLEHGLFVDYKGNVWISGNAGKGWGRILKFTADGKFIMSIGEPLAAGEEPSNNSTTHLGNQPADIFVDPKTNDLYLADGDGGDRRVIVFDAETGAFRRIWGAYGEKPAEGRAAKYDPSLPPSRSFSAGVHCVLVGNDGLVYVCDRNADRIQIFHPDGTFVKEALVSPKTFGNGTVFDLAFSPTEKFMYVADGANQKVWIMQRDTLEIVGSFGQLGHSAGEFRNLHELTVDSKGNIYTAEVSEGKRVQRFVLKGSGTKVSGRKVAASQ
jgi:DNA-binding beta-propeller fold protein YncE